MPLRKPFLYRQLAVIISLLFVSVAISAQELVIMTDDGPPHMIASTGNGIDIDIAKAVFTEMGYRSKVIFAPLARGKLMVEQYKADAFLPTFYQIDSDILFHSDPIIYYRPTIFTLQGNSYKLNKLADIAGKRIVSFQGATGYFGEEYTNAVASGLYRELHDMSKFPEMLLKARVDIVVLDYYIFYYFLNRYCQELTQQVLCQQPIQDHNLISQVSAHIGFNNSKLRDQFNIELKQVKNAGKDKSIIWQYIGQH